VKDAVREGLWEVPQTLGMVGQENWYITKFAALQDATLDRYILVCKEKRIEGNLPKHLSGPQPGMIIVPKFRQATVPH
jgi:hypothetical protein